MKNITIIIIILFFVSCGHRKIRPHFDSIEVTYDNGWTGGTTVYIDSMGIINKCDYHVILKIDSADCFIDTLNNEILDSLNILIENLKNENIDSIYDAHCRDCGGFFVKIKTNDRLIFSKIRGSHEFDNAISKFAWHILGLKVKNNKMILP